MTTPLRTSHLAQRSSPALPPMPPPPGPPPPVIATDVLDPPTQRLYAWGAISMIQAVKVHDMLFARSWPTVFKWLILDLLWIYLLPKLRIPRMSFNKNEKIVLVMVFYALTALFFSDWSVSFNLGSFVPGLSTITSLIPFLPQRGPDISTEERRVWAHDVVDSKAHLLGQHTVKLSPISTAQLNPDYLTFCLAPPYNEALIPILLNNTGPTAIEYSISPLGSKSTKRHVKLSAKDVIKLDKQWNEYFEQVGGSSGLKLIKDQDSEPYDEEYENDLYNSPDRPAEPSGGLKSLLFSSHSPAVKRSLSPQERRFYSRPLQSTQAITHISVNKPGVVRLESMKSGTTDVRILMGEMVVVACPSARFEVPVGMTPPLPRECVGGAKELSIVAEGVAPLKLRWSREINGKKETFDAEGIEGNPEATNVPLSQNITLPIPVALSTIGRYRYAIESLIDGQGNIFDPSHVPQTQTSRSLVVTGRSSVAFKNCGSTRSIDLLKGSDAKMTLALHQGEGGDPIKTITVQYVPTIGSRTSPFTKDYQPKSDSDTELQIPVRQSGTYTILGVNGKECPGDVLSPEVCKVVEQPQPKADVTLESIHECSGDVGVKASLVLHGTPPYTIHYTEQRGREHVKRLSKTIANSRDEIILQPESSGTYTYSFTHVSDKNYRQVPLVGDGLSIKKVVHPLASADFVRSHSGKQRLSSCSGNTVDVDVDLRGTAPWALELQIVDSAGSKIITVPELMKPRSRITIPVPSEIDESGGFFQVNLVSVVDANGCKRSLNVAGISVNVQRVLPTVRFYSSDGQRHTTILQGELASLPLRLTGEGPWSLTYRKQDAPNALETVRVTSPNDYIRVRESGTYELTEVRDKNCPGSVVPLEGTYKVDWVARPTIFFAPSVGQVARNGSIIRPPVCEGTDDVAELDLTGQAPFQISYHYTAPGHKLSERATFNSVQHRTRLHLRTSTGGHHLYQLGALGDASYTLSQDSSRPAGNLGQTLEQTVYTRPTAFFKHSDRMSYCLGDYFSPRAQFEDEGIVELKGQPPFTLELSIKNFATNKEVRETVRVDGHEWAVDFPSYKFDTIGPTLITIESMRDSSPCPASEPQPSQKTLWVDVAETAAVVPFDRKRDYCIGEPISLQLEGTPPWTIKYALNKQIVETTSATSKFTRVPVQPGTFKVLSIAHQRNMCQTAIEGVEMDVHDIPSARVSKGHKRQDTIREGDQATITFELRGIPPFTFTYQRTELAQTEKKGHPPQVKETHTVSGVMSYTYSISSAVEGTWTVTFIADKYCRYPANPPDSSIETA